MINEAANLMTMHVTLVPSSTTTQLMVLGLGGLGLGVVEVGEVEVEMVDGMVEVGRIGNNVEVGKVGNNVEVGKVGNRVEVGTVDNPAVVTSVGTENWLVLSSVVDSITFVSPPVKWYNPMAHICTDNILKKLPVNY